ncbi:MAG TPA: hypothetical protein VKB38_14295 [Terracidiphilus sp.]|nr:hypothetical protein [Terracidiphilus sp.]
MDLWTEFEGVTIDSAFALNKLLQTEGRSAFFSTSNANGEPALIRIIECHFDEDEILARWRGVQSLGHPNFLRIDRFGQFLIEADDITAVYVVFERVDANLGQVLEKGRLSTADATQIGLSMASALEMLHAHGFVHEHVSAGAIYAVGETVKLRSDCIRETPEGDAGFAARRRDVHDLALVLMEVLLGSARTASPHRQFALPAPFDDIVLNARSGEWGLAEIKAALTARPAFRSLPPIPKAAPPASPIASAVAAARFRDPVRRPGEPPAPSPASAQPSQLPGPPEAHFSRPGARAAFLSSDREPFTLPDWLTGIQADSRRWITALVLLAAVVLFGWIVAHRLFGHHAAAAAQPIPETAIAEAPPDHTSPLASAGSHPSAVWRVVAFTYNRKDQAQKKADSLGRKHPELQPGVFSPTGKSPWLVTVGGAMHRDAAYSLARKAPALGLPGDTYAQNYTGR